MEKELKMHAPVDKPAGLLLNVVTSVWFNNPDDCLTKEYSLADQPVTPAQIVNNSPEVQEWRKKTVDEVVRRALDEMTFFPFPCAACLVRLNMWGRLRWATFTYHHSTAAAATPGEFQWMLFVVLVCPDKDDCLATADREIVPLWRGWIQYLFEELGAVPMRPKDDEPASGEGKSGKEETKKRERPVVPHDSRPAPARPSSSASSSGGEKQLQMMRCAHCGRFNDALKGERFKLCGRCKALPYCSAECQKQDWAQTHRFECRPIAERREDA